MIEFAVVADGQAGLAPSRGTTRRAVLTGDVVTMNKRREVIPGGRICLYGRHIVAVLRDDEVMPPGFEGAPVVNTAGTIYPGLMDLHNHLPYNIIPLWQVEEIFENRLQWQKHPAYYPAVKAPFSLLNERKETKYRQSIIRFAECRGLFGGVTTGHGMSLSNGAMYAGLMRNVERPLEPELPTAKSFTPDFSANEEKRVEMLQWTKEGKPYLYHLSEGIKAYGEATFRDIQATPAGLNPHLICIHCVGIPADGWDDLKVVAGIVWSPTSNLLLYGATCDVREAKKRGIPIAIGADWAPSGCKNLLGELKVARAASRHMDGVLSDEDLVAGVTIVPATMVGWDTCLGSIEPGKWADLLVLEGTGGDPYGRLLDAKETAIRAVVIDGRVRLAEANGLVTYSPLSAEQISIGGKPYVIDLAEAGSSGAGGMTLADAIEHIRFGLSKLPEFEKEGKKELFLAGEPDSAADWIIEDEMDAQPFSMMLMMDGRLPARSMTLEPMTAVDDPAFSKAMGESRNMPDYAKKAFDL